MLDEFGGEKRLRLGQALGVRKLEVAADRSDLLVQLVAGDATSHDPHRLGFCSVERATGQEGVCRSPAGHPGEDGQTDHRGGDTQPCLGERERDVVGADGDVGARDHAQSAGTNRPGQPHHHRLGVGDDLSLQGHQCQGALLHRAV
ncbi:MAG: hypothetical protein V9E94_17080 [Microthrixaceae bacterium]